jgi:transposase-like protein
MDGADDGPPLGGEGKIVEADETYFGVASRDLGWRFVNGVGWVRERTEKMKVLTMVERGGRSRSVRLDNITADDIRPHLAVNVSRRSTLATDEATWYIEAGQEFPEHLTVAHRRKEYGRGRASTNTVEGFFSIFKRGMKGIYQHCAEKHLHRYLAEFDFRYSNRVRLGVHDAERAQRAIKGADGRRSTTGNLVAGPRRKTLTRAEFRALLRLVRAGKIAPRKPKAPGAIQLIFDFMLH